MKPKTTREVIDVLKDHIQTWKNTYPNKFGGPPAAIVHDIACLIRAIAIVRLWQADITPADVRAAERKRKGRAKK